MQELIKVIHENNVQVGWWDSPCIETKLMMIITELAEAIEGHRKDLMDDHLPHRKMAEVELADALIRTLDLMGYVGVEFEFIPFDTDNEFPVLMYVASRLVNVNELNTLASFLLHIAAVEAYDIMAALTEKVAYNKKRSDHKRENREKQNGKKY